MLSCMAKRPLTSAQLHQFTIRIDPELALRFDAYAQATGKTYRQLIEPAIERMLRDIKLTPDQQDLVKAHLRVKRSGGS